LSGTAFVVVVIGGGCKIPYALRGVK